jgi:lysophospholipase L1-like esterase
MIPRRKIVRAAAMGLLAALPGAPAEADAIPLAARPLSRLDLPRWKARHEAKLAEIRGKRIDLVFLGDSITEQYEHADREAWRDFRPIWNAYYGDRHALNLGFSGDATCHLLWRIENGEVEGITPRAAVILIGANNLGRLHWSAADTIAGIAAVIRATQRRLPHTRILLLSVLPSDRGAWVEHTSGAINGALAATYGGGAVAGTTYVDVTSIFIRNGRIETSLYADPLETPPAPALHPNADGQRRMAAAIEPALSGLLGDRPHVF